VILPLFGRPIRPIHPVAVDGLGLSLNCVPGVTPEIAPAMPRSFVMGLTKTPGALASGSRTNLTERTSPHFEGYAKPPVWLQNPPFSQQNPPISAPNACKTLRPQRHGCKIQIPCKLTP
jgi:hypothetical protein